MSILPFIISDELDTTESKGRIVFSDLKHPKSGDAAKFVISNGKCFELIRYKRKECSWFIGQTIVSDGSLYICSKIDPLFVILPYLEKTREKFMLIDQILEDEKYPAIKRICVDSNQLQLVSDYKIIGDLNLYRFNQEKTLKWLEQKVATISETLLKKCPDISNSASSYSVSENFVQSKESKPNSESREHGEAPGLTSEDFKHPSYQIVSDYIRPNLSNALFSTLGLKDPELKVAGDNADLGFKRGRSDAPNGVTKSEEPKKKSAKISAAVRRLDKSDKTGMKKLSSFFVPKST